MSVPRSKTVQIVFNIRNLAAEAWLAERADLIADLIADLKTTLAVR